METVSQLQQEMQTTKAKVKQILKDSLEARNNDTILILMFLEREQLNNWCQLWDRARKKNINFESIRRARQFIQAAGEYLPTDLTVIKRRRLQTVYAAVANKEKREQMNNGAN